MAALSKHWNVLTELIRISSEAVDANNWRLLRLQECNQHARLRTTRNEKSNPWNDASQTEDIDIDIVLNGRIHVEISVTCPESTL